MTRRPRRFEIRFNGRAARVVAVVFGLVLVAVTIGCVVYSGADRSSSADAPPERSRAEPLDRLDRIEGWIPSWGDEAKLAREASEAGFTDLLFFHGSVDEDGAVTLEDEPGLAAGLKAAGSARTWLTVTNHGGSLATALGPGMDDHADSLLAAFRRSRCMHLDLDYENLNSTEASALLKLANELTSRMPDYSRLSLTLQPVDSTLRPEQRDVYRRMLQSPDIYTLRLMMYDYHWRGSLPGALCPMNAFARLVKQWAEHAHKLTLCLPLYGYDWPRPEDTSLPRAESITLRDVKTLANEPGFDAVWMREEAELAARYEGHMAALPSLRAITRRVEFGLDWGVPAVSFWHLGCSDPGPVREACKRGAEPAESIRYDDGTSWESWLDPYKRRVCRVIVADGTSSLEQIGDAHKIPRATMYRFNEHLQGSNLRGRTVFIPE
jgi:hypothetical protein